MSAGFRPLRDVLLLTPLAAPGMVGLLHIPDSGLLRDKTGGLCRVVAAGPEALSKAGGLVHVSFYGQHAAADEWERHGKKYIVCRERDTNGIVD